MLVFGIGMKLDLKIIIIIIVIYLFKVLNPKLVTLIRAFLFFLPLRYLSLVERDDMVSTTTSSIFAGGLVTL